MVDKSAKGRKTESKLLRDNEICLVPHCGKPKSVRGMCNYCYQTAKRNIQRGNTTWEELMDAGLALNTHSRQGYLMEALRQYREQKGVSSSTRKRKSASAN